MSKYFLAFLLCVFCRADEFSTEVEDFYGEDSTPSTDSIYSDSALFPETVGEVKRKAGKEEANSPATRDEASDIFWKGTEAKADNKNDAASGDDWAATTNVKSFLDDYF